MRVWFFALIAIFEIFGSNTAVAQFVPWSERQGPKTLSEKSDSKYQDIWSLSDWFEQQHKVRLMDQWLALNSSSNPFEFYLDAMGGRYAQTITKSGVAGTPTNYTTQRGDFGAFASIIGLQAEYQNFSSHSSQGDADVYLRLLGRSQQGTHLGGFYGMSQRSYSSGHSLAASNAAEKFSQQFAGGEISLNFTKFFGVESLAKKYFNNISSLNDQLNGYRLEETFFIDFKFIRVFGTWFQENDNYNNLTSGVQSKILERGVVGGLRLWF